MDKQKRYQELLKKRQLALLKISRAKEALGSGSWHEDSSYELADQDFRVWVDYLENVEKEIEELEEHLKLKRTK